MYAARLVEPVDGRNDAPRAGVQNHVLRRDDLFTDTQSKAAFVAAVEARVGGDE